MIYGRRVRLRVVEAEDLERVRCWRNSPEVYYPMYNWDPITAEMQRHWYETRVLKRERHHYFLVERFVPGESNYRPVGLISLTDVDGRHRRGDVGFYIANAEDRLPGVALEAEYMLLSFAFDQLGLHKVCLEVIQGNDKVAKMHRHYGFELEGRLRGHVWHDGVFKDVLVMGLLASDFAAHREKIEALLERLA
ncbi:acetyltransferase, putative [Heliomicrobium modesticaldum Ice1]|uniref:Acetyltransferase, putative n=1 Tax=Heliobacterium modesticaldum (strain ATCC 51547 / Ice1) TaxID=498761 RepID=B0TH03_HELMI|nr:acetyltransferase, putative [Heliomicrobium modesticaldum Ice1]